MRNSVQVGVFRALYTLTGVLEGLDELGTSSAPSGAKAKNLELVIPENVKGEHCCLHFCFVVRIRVNNLFPTGRAAVKWKITNIRGGSGGGSGAPTQAPWSQRETQEEAQDARPCWRTGPLKRSGREKRRRRNRGWQRRAARADVDRTDRRDPNTWGIAKVTGSLDQSITDHERGGKTLHTHASPRRPLVVNWNSNRESEFKSNGWISKKRIMWLETRLKEKCDWVLSGQTVRPGETVA